MDEFKLKSVVNTYNNAIMLKKYLFSDYRKKELTTMELINSIHFCNVIIISNALIIQNYGLDKSR